jgi:hypothetical protein
MSTLPHAVGGWPAPARPGHSSRSRHGRPFRTGSAPLGRAGLVVALAGLLVVALAGPAQAHVIEVGGRASNYRTDVLAITPPVPGLTVRVLETGNQLALTDRSGQEVVVRRLSLRTLPADRPDWGTRESALT